MQTKTTKPFLFYALLTLACLAVAAGGAELLYHYARLNRLYVRYTYHIMALRLLLPFSLGVLLFFRQRLGEKAARVPKLWVDGISACLLGLYLFLVYQRLMTDLFSRPEALLCLALFLCAFAHGLTKT